MKTGIQVSSLKPLLTDAAGVDAVFGKIAGMGVTTVQHQWIDRGVPAETIAALTEKWGLRSVSVQDFFTAVRDDWDYYAELNRLTGGTWLCVSRIPAEYRTPEGLERYALELTEMQEKLGWMGQRLCFHPVRDDIPLVNGLTERLPWLELCLDLYHLARAGEDMAAWIRRYAGRVCMVHFKDSRMLTDGEQLVPAGQGDIDWTGVVRACLETKVPYGFAEQERWDRDPYACLGEALDWIHGEMEEAV